MRESNITPRQIERFWSKIEKTNNCWKWLGGLNTAGYGEFRIGSMKNGTRAMVLAHRVVYYLTFGTIPDHLTLDHLCRNHWCVNPSHSEPVTNHENILRGEGFSAQNARKSACPKGHPYEGGNLYIDPKGSRYCRECDRVKHKMQRNSKVFLSTN